MKKQRCLLLPFAIALSLLYACGEEKENKPLSFFQVTNSLGKALADTLCSPEEQTLSLQLITDGTWQARFSQTSAWISLSQDSGEGDALVTISLAENQLAADRSVTLSFYENEQPKITATITQRGDIPSLEITPASAILSSEGGTVVFTLVSNMQDWCYTLEEGAWLQEEEKTDTRLCFRADSEPTLLQHRTATLHFTAPSQPDFHKTVTITQTGLTADLLDVKFLNDGRAEDLSPLQHSIITNAGVNLMTYYNDFYSSYVARFTHAVSSNPTDSYYKVDFSANPLFQESLADGHTLEALVMLNAENTGKYEVKVFSAMEGGGTGLLISAGSRGKDLCFVPNVSTDATSKWIFTQSGVVPDLGRYYHVVGVWDKIAAKTYIYIDGELKGCADAPGNFNFPSTSNCYWFGIGGDASKNGTEAAWNGDVAVARIYDAPLSEEAVRVLWERVKRTQSTPPVDLSVKDIFYYPVCKVIPGSSFRIGGIGFIPQDRIRLESLEDAGARFECLSTPFEKYMEIEIPQTLVSGQYRLMLLRGEGYAPLGQVQFTISTEVPSIVAPNIVAHRGFHAAGEAENSIGSLKAAQQLGIYGSECDVWMTSDNQLIVFHDSSVKGMVVQESTFGDLQAITLSNGEKIPTLKSYLRQVAQGIPTTRLVLEVESHSSLSRSYEVVDSIVAMVKREGLEESIDYIAFDRNVCRRLVAQQPRALVSYLNGNSTPSSLASENIMGLDYIYSVLLAQPQWIESAHNLGMKVNVWTVNSDRDLCNAIAMGCDYITTDYPDRLQEIISVLCE